MSTYTNVLQRCLVLPAILLLIVLWPAPEADARPEPERGTECHGRVIDKTHSAHDDQVVSYLSMSRLPKVATIGVNVTAIYQDCPNNYRNAKHKVKVLRWHVCNYWLPRDRANSGIPWSYQGTRYRVKALDAAKRGHNADLWVPRVNNEPGHNDCLEFENLDPKWLRTDYEAAFKGKFQVALKAAPDPDWERIRQADGNPEHYITPSVDPALTGIWYR